MGWGAASKGTKGGGGRFLKPEDGVSHRFAFTGVPYQLFKRWDDNAGKMYIDADSSQGASKVLLLEVVDLLNPSGVQQFECSEAAFRAIVAVMPKDASGAPVADNVSVHFQRTGQKKKTKYNTIAGGPLSAADKVIIAEAVADQRWTLDDVEGAQAFEDDAKVDPYAATPKTAPASNDAPDDDVPF